MSDLVERLRAQCYCLDAASTGDRFICPGCEVIREIKRLTAALDYAQRVAANYSLMVGVLEKTLATLQDLVKDEREACALVADEAAEQNTVTALALHKRSSKQAALYGDDDRAEQTKISAQVLDNCAIEARSIASAIRARGAP